MDSFYKGISTEEDKIAASHGDYNFDSPQAFDWNLIVATLKKIRDGKPVDVPHYCFVQHCRVPGQSTRVYGAGVVIFEGIMTLHNQEVLELLHLKLFVDTDADIRLARRLKRDITERGRELEDVFNQYEKHVKPGYQKYIGPSIENADIVIPRGRDNIVAINLIIRHIKNQLEIRHIKSGAEEFESEIIKKHKPNNLHLLPVTNQVRGCQTIVRNKETSRDDFIFYSERLMRMLFEYALSYLPHCDTQVTMPSGQIYQGKKFAGSGLCGVSILRAGETMEKAIMQVTKQIRLGKLLIQTNQAPDHSLMSHII
jgi:uridine kinase